MTEPQLKRQHAIDALEAAEHLLLQSGGEREQILCRVAIKAVYGDFYETALTRGFNLGNATKYIWRADLKGNAIEDLKKARWYLDREIAKREQEATK